MLLDGELNLGLSDEGIIVKTEKRDIQITFNPERFRPSDVPILLADTSKIRNLGFSTKYALTEIVKDQLNYYMNPEKRHIH